MKAYHSFPRASHRYLIAENKDRVLTTVIGKIRVLYMWIVKYLPRKKLSKWVGRWAFTRFPKPIQNFINLSFAKHFGINLNETEFPYYDYNSLGDFFIRRLKVGARPLGGASVVHPCDSRIAEKGKIFNGRLLQAKGVDYSLEHLTQIENAMEKYDQGYFVTYYLSPKDYHRVHSPVDGMVTQMMYCTGDLWPVNDWSILNIPGVYTENERVYVEIATEKGPIGLVFVGATNVGSIAIKFEKKLFTNWKLSTQNYTYQPPIEVKKGEEIGMFKMGSTIVALFSPEWHQEFKNTMDTNTTVKMGQNFFSSAK